VQGVKHLIQCHCVLPQYRKLPEPLFHKFVVFSIIDDQDQVIPKAARCNNCGAVHKIVEIGRSEVALRKEDSRAIITQAELAMSLPEDVVKLFQTYDVDLATWEQAAFVLDNQQWGTAITLVRETEDDDTTGKVLVIMATNRFRVESFNRKEFMS
jgi:hypothetical protein